MIRIPGRIPILIHPSFWIIAVLIGLFNSSFDPFTTLLWIIVILVSVVVHEFGHALTALSFGLSPRIELMAFGGLTYHQGEKLSYLKQFFIILNGPLFGFLLYLGALFLLPVFKKPAVHELVQLFVLVNLVWTILNLVPVLPLDGGQLLRVVLEGIFGVKGFRYSLLVGTIISGLLSLGFFFTQNLLVGALFFLFAFQSYEMWRKTRLLSDKDRQESLKTALTAAEELLEAGKKDEAINAFEEIRQKAKQGMIYTMATQYLAFLYQEKNALKQVYTLLQPIKSELSAEALSLLHRAAFEEKDYPLVEELSGLCFQHSPSAEVALINAYAEASLAKIKPAIGWLETAFQQGLENMSEVVSAPYFDPIRKDPHFQAFLKHHQDHYTTES